MSRIRAGGMRRQQVRAGAPDRSLTANAGLAAITELCGRLGVIEALDAAVGPVKQRDRGFGAGELLTGIAAAQLAGEDFLTGLDRQRADAASRSPRCPGWRPRPRRAWPGGSSGSGGAGWSPAWRWSPAGMPSCCCPRERAAALAAGPVTIDLDTTDVEVYGRKKRGVAYNHQGQRVVVFARGGLGRDRDRAGR